MRHVRQALAPQQTVLAAGLNSLAATLEAWQAGAEGAELPAEQLLAAADVYPSIPATFLAAASLPADALRMLPRLCGNSACCGLAGDSEASLPLPKTCRRCQAVSYCSGECQLAHWRAGHSRECTGAAAGGQPAAGGAVAGGSG